MPLTVTLPPPATQNRSGARKIRVVHLVSTLNIGGLEKVVYDLLSFADRTEFDFQVWCLGEVGALGGLFHEIGIEAVSLDVLKKGTLRAAWELQSRLRANPVDVLHTHNPSPHIIGVAARFLSGTPVLVHTKHGRNYPKNRRKVFGNRLASWCSDQIVAVSRNAADVAREIERVAACKVSVIHNGIDFEQFEPTEKGTLVRRAIHVARLTDPPKDHKTLLEATKIVTSQIPDFHLDIIGDGPQRAAIEQWCDDLGMRDHVRFWGFRSDVPELMKGVDLVLLSSLTEGLSITLLEAMAAGLPVVATDVGGNPEVVEEGRTGLLVPPQRPEAMAAAMLKIIQTPGLADEMGRAGRFRVERDFNLRTVVRKYESLYRDLLAKRGKLPANRV